MDLTETRIQWEQARKAAESREKERLMGPGVPMYDPSIGRIVYVEVDWAERKPKL